MRVKDVARHIEKWCPKSLAEDWDNVGLMVGDAEQEVKKVMVALDGVDEVIDEAIKEKVDMIVTHHPLIFKPIKNVTTNHTAGRLIYKLIKNNISLYSAHTNLDAADGGINDFLADALGLVNKKPLETFGHKKLKKLVVFVPESHTDAVRDAIGAAGAGWIGNYSDCTFSAEGTGTFKPLEGTHPYIGETGKLEKAKEYRIETILTEDIQSLVIKAMLKAHPYEEVAYDIYLLENKGEAYGIGRVGEMPQEVAISQLVDVLKEKLSLDSVTLIGDINEKVKKVAICSGSGMSLLNEAIRSGADVYLTGDVKYHDAQEALAHGINVIDAGHYGTENIIVPVIKKYIEELNGIEVIETTFDGNPFKII